MMKVCLMTNWRQILSWKAKFTHHKDVLDGGFHAQENPVTENYEEVEPEQGDRITRNWAEVTCPICLENKAEAILYKEHSKEAKRRRAEFTNLGWSSGDDFIQSKTNRGKLFTCIDPETLKVEHEWGD